MSNVRVPKILIPNKSIDLQKWSTIACDQFCARPKYWEELESFVSDAPSTLRLTCPEIYLNKGDLEEPGQRGQMGSDAWKDLREACGLSAEVTEGAKGQEAVGVNSHEIVVLR